MKYLNTIIMHDSIDQMRARIVIEQGAMHQVQLSVARWRGEAGGKAGACQEPEPAMAASQVKWHAAAQYHFLCWLAKGGFAQACAEAEVASPVNAIHAAAEAEAQIPPADYYKCNCTA